MASGDSPPPYLGVGDVTFALYTVDAALAEQDVVNGSNLSAEDPGIGPYAENGVPGYPAFPVVIGTSLPGTWQSLQSLPSATDWGLAVGGYFVRLT